MSVARVVSIEDEMDMIELLRLILHRRGYEVIGARGGEEGLVVVREYHPDLVLLDLMMPDLNGWEVYRQLKEDPNTLHIPVIIVTAKVAGKDRLRAVRETNVDDYIIKPFAPAQLLDLIDTVLARNKRL